jgi:peptide subunit release factor RF-3
LGEKSPTSGLHASGSIGSKTSYSSCSSNGISGKKYPLSQAQVLLGNNRGSIENAYPGDVIKINNSGDFAIGDTIYPRNRNVAFPSIPMFSPAKFAYIHTQFHLHINHSKKVSISCLMKGLCKRSIKGMMMIVDLSI